MVKRTTHCKPALRRASRPRLQRLGLSGHGSLSCANEFDAGGALGGGRCGVVFVPISRLQEIQVRHPVLTILTLVLTGNMRHVLVLNETGLSILVSASSTIDLLCLRVRPDPIWSAHGL